MTLSHQAACDDEVLLLGLVAEEAPLALQDGVVREACPPGHCQVLTFGVQGSELKLKLEKK